MRCGRRGREAEGGGLLNRYRVVKLYRGIESLRLRQNCIGLIRPSNDEMGGLADAAVVPDAGRRPVLPEQSH